MDQLHELHADAKRRGALDAVLEVTAASLNAESEAVRNYDDHSYSMLVRQLPYEQRMIIGKARDAAYAGTLAAIKAMIEVNNAMRTWEFPGIDDRRYVADIRCHIIDAEWKLTNGLFNEVYEDLLHTIQLLHWLIYERRYGGSKASRQPPTTAVLDAAARVLESLGNAAENVYGLVGSVA